MIEIQEKETCCGCTACAAICPKGCITMQSDAEGFLYPQIDAEQCVRCGLCERVCPILNPVEEVETKQDAYLMQHSNLQIRKESTSGGAFTVIAEYVIRHDGVVLGRHLIHSMWCGINMRNASERLRVYRYVKRVTVAVLRLKK